MVFLHLQFNPGAIIVFSRSDYERSRDSADPTHDGFSKYSPKWSLPARVLSSKSNQVKCVEIGTGRQRDVPLRMCKLLPPEVPVSLQRINAEHLKQSLPRRLAFADLPFDTSGLVSPKSV